MARVILVLASFGSVITGRSPNTPSSDILLAPNSSHLMGTDESVGTSLPGSRWVPDPVKVAGLAGAPIGLVVGGFLGVAAASSHRIVDGTIMRSMDVLLVFPAIGTCPYGELAARASLGVRVHSHRRRISPQIARW